MLVRAESGTRQHKRGIILLDSDRTVQYRWEAESNWNEWDMTPLTEAYDLAIDHTSTPVRDPVLNRYSVSVTTLPTQAETAFGEVSPAVLQTGRIASTFGTRRVRTYPVIRLRWTELFTCNRDLPVRSWTARL